MNGFDVLLCLQLRMQQCTKLILDGAESYTNKNYLSDDSRNSLSLLTIVIKPHSTAFNLLPHSENHSKCGLSITFQ